MTATAVLQEDVLSVIRGGGTLDQAALVTGRTRALIRTWRNTDPAFADAVLSAFAERRMGRFEDKLIREPNSGCWLWIGAYSDDGYGAFKVAGRQMRAHRFAYESLVGSIPEGLELDHLCRTLICVNPAHLEPVTNVENILRGFGPAAINARKTECKHGHAFTPANTHVHRSGRRICRTCSRERWARRTASA